MFVGHEKSEEISSEKHLILRNTDDLSMNDDQESIRSQIGIGGTKKSRVTLKMVPAGFELFVQSTSPNRKLGDGPVLVRRVDNDGNDDGDDDESDSHKPTKKSASKSTSKSSPSSSSAGLPVTSTSHSDPSKSVVTSKYGVLEANDGETVGDVSSRLGITIEKGNAFYRLSKVCKCG